MRLISLASRRRLGRAAATCVLALAALALPTATGTAVAAGAVQDLGVPISNYLILDSVLAPDAQGRPTLYGSTYNVPSQGVTFFGIDPVTGDIRTELTMPGAYGGYHVTAAPNGRIYLGPLNAVGKPQIWEYNPQTNTIGIAATAPAGLFCFGMAASPNGNVYCGAYGKGIYEYNPTTGALRFLLATETFPKGLLPLDSNRLLIAEGTPARVLVLNLTTGQTTDILPPQYDNYSFAYNAVEAGNSIYVQLVTPDARLIRFDVDTLEFKGELPTVTGMGVGLIHGNQIVAVGPDPDKQGVNEFYTVRASGQPLVSPTGVTATWQSGPQVWPVQIGGQTWYTSVGVNGQLGRWNPDTGQVWTHQLSLPGSPTTIESLAQAPDGSMCGGTYETNSLFCYHPDTGETVNLGNVAPGRTGEILSEVSTHGKLFMGSYINNVITVYDPTKPWAPGTAAGSNPLDLGPVGDQQYRPYGMTVGPDGRVWVASAAAYGVLSGALTAIDPDTYAVQSFRGLAGPQHFFSIATAGNYLVAGTSVIGDNTNAGGSAEVLVVTTSGQVVSTTIPVPGALRIEALTTAPDGTVFGSTDAGTWFRFDPKTATILASGTSPYGDIHDLVTGPGGLIYGLTNSGLFRIDPAGNSFEFLTAPGSDRTRTLAFDSAGRAYWGNDAHLLRYTP